MARTLSAALALATLLWAGTASAATPARFALVVGNNQALPRSGYEPLRYADDDALRFAAFMRELGAQVELFAGPDPDTVQRFGSATDSLVPPTRDRVLEAIGRLAESIDQARGGERPTELYFYFSGHGSVSSADAWLHLLDGPFSRLDLHEQILRRLKADRVHVIIDSCHSYFLVNARGERIAVAQEEDDLDRYPHAGFLLSTSQRKEVHEWSGYEAGVFSYQLLGAMRGAADVDRDGRVAYAEAQAYLAAANADITDNRARIEPYVRAPARRDAQLVPAADAVPRRVEVPVGLQGHFFVADAHGRRILDANKPPGLALALALPQDGDLFLHVGEEVWVARKGGEGRFAALAPESADGPVASRGTLADQFRERLFLRPLTPDFVGGFALAASMRQSTYIVQKRPMPPWAEDPITLALLGAGAVGLLGGVVAGGLWADARDEANARPVTSRSEAARERAELRQAAMAASLGLGFALAGAGIVRALLTNEPDGDGLAVSPVGPGARPGLSVAVELW